MVFGHVESDARRRRQESVDMKTTTTTDDQRTYTHGGVDTSKGVDVVITTHLRSVSEQEQAGVHTYIHGCIWKEVELILSTNTQMMAVREKVRFVCYFLLFCNNMLHI